MSLVGGLSFAGALTTLRAVKGPTAPSPEVVEPHLPPMRHFGVEQLADPRADVLSSVPSAEPEQRRARAAPSRDAPSIRREDPDLLAEQLRLIERARQDVQSRDAATALRDLDEYQRRFPRGHLRTESTVLRVEALVLAGDHTAARQLAGSFLLAHPDSPYARRLRTLLAGTSEEH
jgi:hypothetical protein